MEATPNARELTAQDLGITANADIRRYLEETWGEAVDNDAEINGADAVDALVWLVNEARRIKPPELVVFVDGGMVTDVLSDQEINATIIDADIETADAILIHSPPDGTEVTVERSPATIADLTAYLALCREPEDDDEEESSTE